MNFEKPAGNHRAGSTAADRDFPRPAGDNVRQTGEFDESSPAVESQEDFTVPADGCGLLARPI